MRVSASRRQAPLDVLRHQGERTQERLAVQLQVAYAYSINGHSSTFLFEAGVIGVAEPHSDSQNIKPSHAFTHPTHDIGL